MQGFVAVIVLNWNSAIVTGSCLRSLRQSTYRDMSIIVVDNGSHDGSADMLEAAFPEITVLRNPTNLGFTGGVNVGLRYILSTDAAYALLLNNDTIVAPDAIEHLVSAVKSDPDVAMACPKIYSAEPPNTLWYAGGELSFWRGVGCHIGRRMIDRGQFDQQRYISFVTGCAVLIRRSAVEQLGLLDERLYNYGDDTDLSFRAARSGVRLLYVPEAKVWHFEGFDMKRNAGQAFRLYYATRSSLLVMAKHASPMHWLTFAPYFAVNWILRHMLLSLAHGDGAAIAAMARAVRDFLSLRKRSGEMNV